jgi:hypothetical protein
MWPPWRSTKYIIRGKVVASPKFGPWWVLWIWFMLAPKVFKLCTNQLVVWFVQIHVSDWTLVILPSPIPKLQHAPLPPKCYEPGSMPQFFAFRCFHFRLSIESIKELGSASIMIFKFYVFGLVMKRFFLFNLRWIDYHKKKIIRFCWKNP